MARPNNVQLLYLSRILRHSQHVARFALAANSVAYVIMPKQFLRIHRKSQASS